MGSFDKGLAADTAAQASPTEKLPRRPTLRSGFIWTFAGNSIYAAGQWGILSLFAKFGGSEMLGQYALAAAATAPVGMLFHLNLRSVLATDVNRQRPFGDYLAFRLGASALSLVVIAGVACISTNSATLIWTIIAVGAGHSIEAVSDLFLGAMQRREQMQQVALSMILRTVVSVAALAVALAMTRHLSWSVFAMTAARLAVLLIRDVPTGKRGEDLSRSGMASAIAIFRTALPLGIVLMLVSLIANLPRYAIESTMGFEQLGVFAALISFVTIGSTVVNALGQSVTPRLAGHFREGQKGAFLGILGRMVGLVVLLGAVGSACAWGFGGLLLTLLYRPEFADYGDLLAVAVGAGTLSYLAVVLGYAVTCARIFAVQAPLFALSAAGCGIASWILVPAYGLVGGILSIALAATLQIIGQILILAWAFRRQEQHA